MLGMALGCYQDVELIYSLTDGESVARLESMYDPTNRKPGRDAWRQSDTDFAMFGFYVMNNVGIAFRTFALGLVVGVGSLFILVFNGLMIGAAAGHLTTLGYGETFWPFVSGHAALELTAIAISGAAGLLLASALLAPGQRRRRDALRENAREAVKLVNGALIMLVLAALVEAFWSAETGTDSRDQVPVRRSLVATRRPLFRLRRKRRPGCDLTASRPEFARAHLGRDSTSVSPWGGNGSLRCGGSGG